MAKINWKSKDDLEKERRAAELAAELEAEKAEQQAAVQDFVVEQVAQMIESDELTEGQRDRFLNVFPPFTPGADYQPGEKLRFRGVVYEVIQDHTAQADWLPPDVPALFKVFHQTSAEDPETGEPVEVVPDFKQPTGGHDAYKKGDKVAYKDGVYESTMDGNIWAPDAYPAGWKELNQ